MLGIDKNPIYLTFYLIQGDYKPGEFHSSSSALEKPREVYEVYHGLTRE